jgi:hypothetical protein
MVRTCWKPREPASQWRAEISGAALAAAIGPAVLFFARLVQRLEYVMGGVRPCPLGRDMAAFVSYEISDRPAATTHPKYRRGDKLALFPAAVLSLNGYMFVLPG